MNLITYIRSRYDIFNIRRIFAIGLFVSGIRSSSYILKNHNRKDFIRSIIGSILSGISIKIDNKLDKSNIFTIWVALLAGRCLVPNIQFGSIICMCVASCIFLPPYVYAPNELNRIFYNFLVKYGGKSRETLELCSDKVRNSEITDRRLCPYIHPDETCVVHSSRMFIESIPRSFRLYIPLYIIMYIINPKRDMVTTSKSIIRSSLFLSTYCSMAWVSSCLYDYINPSKISIFKFYSHVWTVGLASIIEKPKRRTDLATYCLSYALDHLYNKSVGRDYEIPNLNAGIISISTGLLLYYKRIPFKKYLLI